MDIGYLSMLDAQSNERNKKQPKLPRTSNKYQEIVIVEGDFFFQRFFSCDLFARAKKIEKNESKCLTAKYLTCKSRTLFKSLFIDFLSSIFYIYFIFLFLSYLYMNISMV